MSAWGAIKEYIVKHSTYTLFDLDEMDDDRIFDIYLDLKYPD